MMSLYDYLASQKVLDRHYPFYALLMALMYQVDTTNTMKLKMMWPEVWAELQERYNAPDGRLESERSWKLEECEQC